MGATPHANGGRAAARRSTCPTSRDYALDVDRARASIAHETTRPLGELLRDIYPTSTTDGGGNFRLFCPDETDSNRLGAVFEADGPLPGGADAPTSTTTSAPTAG